MFIPILQKIYIRYAVVKDLKDGYDKYFLKCQGQADVELLSLSRFMEVLVMNYSKKCKRIIARRITMPRLYLKILYQYDSLNNLTKSLNAKTSEIQEQKEEVEDTIKKEQLKLSKLKQYWGSVNQTGIITPEMGVPNMAELKKDIDGIESKIHGLERKKSELQSKLDLSKEEEIRNTEFARSSIRKLIILYEHKIALLYQIIDNVSCRYDEYLNYYWYLFTKRLEKHTNKIFTKQSKSFSEICELKNTHLMKREEIFFEECQFINKYVKKLVDFEIDV